MFTPILGYTWDIIMTPEWFDQPHIKSCTNFAGNNKIIVFPSTLGVTLKYKLKNRYMDCNSKRIQASKIKIIVGFVKNVAYKYALYACMDGWMYVCM